MKATVQRVRRGFTIIELTVAMAMGIATGAMVLALCNQQLAFLKLYKAQNFLTDEAPIISMYVSQLIGKADSFRLHNSVDNALSAANSNPLLTGCSVVVLNFRQPDGTMRTGILSFEDLGTGPALYYRVQGGTPWAVTKAPSAVDFSMSEGVLRMTLTGPKRERITYSGTMQQ